MNEADEIVPRVISIAPRVAGVGSGAHPRPGFFLLVCYRKVGIGTRPIKAHQDRYATMGNHEQWTLRGTTITNVIGDMMPIQHLLQVHKLVHSSSVR